MLARDHVLEITGALECGDHEDEKRHRTAGRARENVNAEHGREPAVVQTHQPVERAKRQTEREERKAREGDFAKSNGELRIAVLILPNRKSPEQLRRDDEEAEEESGAQDEEVEIQVGALGIERRLFSGCDIHPFIKMVSQKEDRDEKDRQDSD